MKGSAKKHSKGDRERIEKRKTHGKHCENPPTTNLYLSFAPHSHLYTVQADQHCE